MTRKMKNDLIKAAELIEIGYNPIIAFYEVGVNVFKLLQQNECQMLLRMDGDDFHGIRPHEFKNFHLTHIAMMITMPEDMIDENL